MLSISLVVGLALIPGTVLQTSYRRHDLVPEDKDSCVVPTVWNPSTYGWTPFLDSSNTDNVERAERYNGTKAGMVGLVAGAALYCEVYGGFPASPDRLIEFSKKPDLAGSCRLSIDRFRDEWGNPIYYSATRERLELRSAGADGLFSTADDIVIPLQYQGHQQVAVNAEAMCLPKKPSPG